MTTQDRLSQWLRIWVIPMAAFALAAVGAVIFIAVRDIPGWPQIAEGIGAFAVITIAANMWMAWEATKPWTLD